MMANEAGITEQNGEAYSKDFKVKVEIAKETKLDVGLLVETIKQYEFVFNTAHKDYKNAKKKALAWEEIALILNCSVEDCQRTWKSLRDRFIKEKNKGKLGPEASESNWQYFNAMLFYGQYSKPRKMYTSNKNQQAEKDTLSRSFTAPSFWSMDNTVHSSPPTNQSEDDIEVTTPELQGATPFTSRGTTPSSSRDGFEAGLFLAAISSASAVFGFGATVIAAKKQDPKYFGKGMMPSKELPETGASLALRALGWGSIYAFAGCGVLFYTIWKLSGAQNFEEFRLKMGQMLPTIPKSNQPQGRTEFSGLNDLLGYLQEQRSAKDER